MYTALMRRFSPLITRLALFAGIFILESGVTGSWLISTQRLLYPYGFWIYGSAGKVLLFSFLVLALLLRDQLKKISIDQWKTYQTYGVIASLSLLFPFFLANMNLLRHQSLLFAGVAHLSLIGMVSLAFSACFPYAFLKSLVLPYRKKIIVALCIGLGFWIGMERLFSFWPILSHLVLNAVVFLLSFSHHDVTIVPPLTIRFIQFSITIGQYCSGIESLLLLSVLYIILGCLDHAKIHVLRYIGLYIVLIIGMFVVNIIRVYAIIQAGFLISPQVAAKFFHTYLGMLLFISYFLLMIFKFYPSTLRLSKQK